MKKFNIFVNVLLLLFVLLGFISLVVSVFTWNTDAMQKDSIFLLVMIIFLLLKAHEARISRVEHRLNMR